MQEGGGGGVDYHTLLRERGGIPYARVNPFIPVAAKKARYLSSMSTVQGSTLTVNC